MITYVLCAAPDCHEQLDPERTIGFAFREPVPVSGIPGLEQGQRVEGTRYFCDVHEPAALQAIQPLLKHGVKRIF